VDGMKLPQDILNRFERRWAARISQQTFHSRVQEVQSQRAIPEGLDCTTDAAGRQRCRPNHAPELEPGCPSDDTWTTKAEPNAAAGSRAP